MPKEALFSCDPCQGRKIEVVIVPLHQPGAIEACMYGVLFRLLLMMSTYLNVVVRQ